jgi:uncharacterized protein (TIGR00297 family)
MAFLTLDRMGFSASLIMALALMLLGQQLGMFFVLLMVYFLVLSAVVTWAGVERKKALKLYQYDRGVSNVIANGGCPTMIAGVFFVLTNYMAAPGLAFLAVVGFMSSVAAITADKFSSELGVLDGMPRQIFTLRKVRRGVSGGVTSLGLAAGLAGSILIAAGGFAISGQLATLEGQRAFSMAAVFASVAAAGFVGTVVDSMLGYYEERGIGNKFTSNFLCSVCGALAGVLLLAAL